MKLVLALFSVSLIALGALTVHVVNTMSSINETTNLLREYTNASNEAAVGRENQIQDSLEERIGTLEHEVEDLKSIVGNKK